MLYATINDFKNANYSPQSGMKKRAYIADDHLLISEKLGSNEDYIRVAFSDIRFIMVKKTEPKVMYLIFGIIALIAIRLVGVFMLIRYFRARGSCACYLVTDVQTIRIPIPFKYKKVPEFVQLLRSRGVSIPAGTSFSDKAA